MILSETTLRTDGSVVLWAKADSVLHKHQINNYSS